MSPTEGSVHYNTITQVLLNWLNKIGVSSQFSVPIGSYTPLKSGSAIRYQWNASTTSPIATWRLLACLSRFTKSVGSPPGRPTKCVGSSPGSPSHHFKRSFGLPGRSFHTISRITSALSDPSKACSSNSYVDVTKKSSTWITGFPIFPHSHCGQPKTIFVKNSNKPTQVIHRQLDSSITDGTKQGYTKT